MLLDVADQTTTGDPTTGVRSSGDELREAVSWCSLFLAPSVTEPDEIEHGP